MNKKIMTMPWSVNIRLYVCADMIVSSGVSSSMRMSIANTPPRKSATVTQARNMSPMRL